MICFPLLYTNSKMPSYIIIPKVCLSVRLKTHEWNALELVAIPHFNIPFIKNPSCFFGIDRTIERTFNKLFSFEIPSWILDISDVFLILY